MTNEQCDRLRKARIRLGFGQANEASAAFGWNKNTYKSHENGIRGLSQKAAERYGKAFSVSPWWLLTGENPPDWLDSPAQAGITELPVRRVPVLTTQQAFSLTEGQKLEQIKNITEYAVIGVDPMLGPDVFALKIEDEAMQPEYRPGEFIAVDPASPYKPGDFVAIALNSRKEAIVRQYRITGYDESGAEMISLHALNETHPDIAFTPGKTGEIIGKVVWYMRKY